MELNKQDIAILQGSWLSKRYLLDVIGNCYDLWEGRIWAWQEVHACSLCERGCSCCPVEQIFGKTCSSLSDFNSYVRIKISYRRVFAVTNILDKLMTIYIAISELDTWGGDR